MCAQESGEERRKAEKRRKGEIETEKEQKKEKEMRSCLINLVKSRKDAHTAKKNRKKHDFFKPHFISSLVFTHIQTRI